MENQTVKLKSSTSLFKNFVKYASLNMIGMLGVSLFILADTFFIANGVGADGLAALNLVLPVVQVMNGLGLMIGMGAATRFSLTKSQEDTQTVNVRFSIAAYVLLFLSLVLSIIGLFFSRPLSAFLGADGSTLNLSTTYVRWMLSFAPFFMFNLFIQCFVRNDGNPGLAMKAMLIGSFSNILLDYLFIFPLGWGMAGAASATAFSQIISLGVMSMHFSTGKNTFTLLRLNELRNHPVWSEKKQELKEILSLGFPTFLSELSLGVILLLFNSLLLAVRGTIAVSAYGIIANLSIVLTALFNGLAQGVQPLMSLTYGESREEGESESNEVRTLFRYGVVTSLLLAFLLYGLILLFPESIVSLFNNDNIPELTQIAVRGLMIYFAAYPFIGLNIFIANSLSAINQPKRALIITLLRGFLLVIPVTLVLAYFFEITGIWASAPLFEMLTALVAIYFWNTKKAKKTG
ncbi:MATE family efflux transporter [Alkalibacterium iburiense]|uniref:Multidrug export protein MepA n=1 Tax=Alkalibacterium iburiense TaxID=290589 RepID=A0ABN0XFG7_9LACT